MHSSEKSERVAAEEGGPQPTSPGLKEQMGLSPPADKVRRPRLSKSIPRPKGSNTGGRGNPCSKGNPRNHWKAQRPTDCVLFFGFPEGHCNIKP